MDVLLRQGNLATRPAGAAAIGILEGVRKPSGAAAAIDKATRGAVSALLASRDLTGKFLECAVLYPRGLRAKRLIVVGLGRRDALDAERVRQAAALVVRRARDLGAGTLATVVHGAGAGGLSPERAAQAVAEGSVLGHYRYAARQREGGSAPLKRVELVEFDAAHAPLMRPAAERGARWAESACITRTLANTPGNELPPERLAARAREIARESGASIEVLGPREMEKLGMGALLAVGQGSVNPPRFIVLEHGGKRSASRSKRAARSDGLPPVVVIGKGVTFDTGGISIKPRENMHKMKYDMSGAAVVLGLFAALPSLDLPFRVIGLIPSAENMPGGRAYKPGDVITAMNGTTIEVQNTDAEGRLLLADALCYAQRYEPQAAVDLATLTGTISLALGNRCAGLFTQSAALGAQLEAAGRASGERLWSMPLWDEYAEDLRSDSADFSNIGGRAGGAILAAIFLRQFAGPMPWAHLDIAGTSWADADKSYASRGATGFGVRLLLEWLARRGEWARANG